jgi:hypothetical protein
MDDDSNARRDTKEADSTNKDGNKGHATLTPVCPTTLFNDNRIPVSCQMERNKASILDGIWRGSHNIILLTRFVACHFVGDWNSHLPFAHWVDTQLLENPSSAIQLDNWHSLKSDGRDSSALPSFLDAKRALDCRPAVRHKRLDDNFLGHNLFNKTDIDSIESPPLIGPGTVATATARCTSLRKNSLAKTSSRHPDIHTMFPTMCAHIPAKVDAAQVMEDDIVLQEAEEATRGKRLQALRVKFSTAAQIELGSKEKGVSWSPQESKLGPPSPGNSMTITPSNCTPTVPTRGSNTGGPPIWTK